MPSPDIISDTKKGTETGARPSLLVCFLQVATVVAISAFLLRKVEDPDPWWQVAIGRDILARFAVPHSDHFAAAALGRPYHDSHWLFQVVVALADRIRAGMAGVQLVMAALWGATFVGCYRAVRSRISPTAACLLVFIVAMACNARFIPRPELVTYLMISDFNLRLQNGLYRTPADLLLFAFLQIVWSNSHGLFVIGPFMAGCYLCEAAMGRYRGRATDLSAAAALLTVLLAATLVTPFGFDGWRYALLLLKEAGPGSPELFKNLAELAPTFGSRTMFHPDFLCYLALLLAVTVTTVPLLVRRQVALSRLLIVAAMLAASMTGRRNMPLFAITAAPLIAENVCRYSLRYTWPAAAKAVCATVLLLLGYLPVSGLYYRLINKHELFGIGAEAAVFPVGLPDYLRRIGYAGQLYHPNILGGFCLYHGFRPLTDGRWEVYDPDLLERIRVAPYAQDTWEWLVATYDITGVILRRGQYGETNALYPRLKRDGRFRLAYYDTVCSFWLRSDSLPQ